ncbi:ATP synthase F(1) complex subunit delta, mitochondrial-like [Glandiceps talaboti]
MSLLRSFSRLSRVVSNVRTVTAVQPMRRYAEEAAAASQAMAFTFATPTQMFYREADVKQVDVPSSTGNFGILPQHVPVLSVIKPGVVTVYESDGAENKYFVSSGTITVNADSSVQVLAEEAVPLDQLDKEAIEQGLTKAQQDVQSSTEEVTKAEALIALEVHEALAKALDK